MVNKNPFKGPESYTDRDSDLFFGRDIEKASLHNLISSSTLSLLYSKSGYGKSSLIQAGLIPLLSDFYTYLPFVFTPPAADIPFDDYWQHNVIEEINRKMDKYQNSCFKKNVEDVDLFDNKLQYEFEYRFSKQTDINYDFRKISLFDFLHSTKLVCTMTKRLKDHVDNNQISVTKKPRSTNDIETEEIQSVDFIVVPVLVFDQFEEIFTTRFSDKLFTHNLIEELRYPIERIIPERTIKDLKEKSVRSKSNKLSQLMNTMGNATDDFRILFSFREEYLTKFESLRSRIPSIMAGANRFCLEPFQKKQATEVIQKISPEIRNVAGFADEIVNKLANNPDSRGYVDVEPFILSLFCFFIYEDVIAKLNVSESLDHSEDEKLEIAFKQEYLSLIRDNTTNNVNAPANDSMDVYAQRYCDLVFNSFRPEVREIVASTLITRDPDTGINKPKLVLKDDLIENSKLSSEDVDILLGLKTENDARGLRYLKEENFLDEEYIIILHDRLIKPLISIKEKDKLRKELSKIRRKYIIGIAGILILMVVGIIVVVTGKQSSFMGESRVMRGINPNIAYTIATEAERFLPFNPNIKEFLKSFDTRNESFLTNRIASIDPIEKIHILGRSDSIIIYSQSGVFIYNKLRKLIKWFPSQDGRVLTDVIVAGKPHVLVDIANVDTCELRTLDGIGLGKFQEGTQDPAKISSSLDGNHIQTGNFIYHLDSNVKRPDTLLFPNNTKGIMDIGFCPDNKHLFASYWTGYFDIFNLKGKPIKSFGGKQNQVITSVAFTRNLKYAVTGDHENMVKVWEIGDLDDSVDMKSLKINRVPKLNLSGHSAFVTSVAISPEDSLILSGGDDRFVILWNFKGKRLGVFRGADDKIKSVGFSKNDKSIYAVTESNKLYIWQQKKASILVKQNELYPYSQLDFVSVGLESDRHKIELDTSSFSKLVQTISDLGSSLPLNNPFPGNDYYALELKRSIEELKELYTSLFRKKEFKDSLSVTANLILRRSYADIINRESDILNTVQVDYSIPGLKNNNYIFKNIYDRAVNHIKVSHVLFKDTLDIYDAIPYTEDYITIGKLYSDSLQVKSALKWINRGVDLSKQFISKYPRNEKFKDLISTGYEYLFWLNLYSKKSKEAQDAGNARLGYLKDSYEKKVLKVVYSLLASGQDAARIQFTKIKNDRLMPGINEYSYKLILQNEALPKIQALKLIQPQHKQLVVDFENYLKMQPDPKWYKPSQM